ncbi:hypothetical protein ACJ41O_013529 [Fusarium nematophilum]
MDRQYTSELLRDGEVTTIAELNPEISNPPKRVVDGTITITWPFSIINKSIAFLLAERDFRLRRDKGQVRIRFHGAAAKAIADASLGGGDEIRLSLDGVKWEKNETQTQVAGSTLEWQLEFTNRVALSIHRPDSADATNIDIDSPNTEAEATNGQLESTEPNTTTADSDPEIQPPQSPEVSIPTKRNAPLSLEPQEFASPAFLKRARVSYGSLFEGGLDIFDEDASRKTKARKRTRFSLPANSWRYASQSPSPELDEEPQEADQDPEANGSLQQNGEAVDTPMVTPPRPAMVDEGCQTMDVDFTPMPSVQVLAESRPTFGFPHSTPTPLPRTKPIEEGNVMLNHTLDLQGDARRNQDDIHHGPHPDFLGPSPGHVDAAIAFGFGSQTVLFPSAPGLFSTDNDQHAVESPNHGARAEHYPAEFLDTTHLQPTTIDVHPALADPSSHIGSLTTTHEGPFGTEPALHPTFTAPPQPCQSAWAPEASPGPISTVIASADVENPVEILSSSPMRDDGESSDERPSPPSQEIQNGTLNANASPEPELEEPSSEAQHYRDGGDEPGDDYDLRNYDRAHDDDDDVESSEEEQDPDENDPDSQIVNPEEDGEDDDEEAEEEELDENADYDEENMYEEHFEVVGQEFEGSDGDVEGEYYSEEEGSYDEEEDDDDEGIEYGPPRASAASEPVFISLLSDSEDEDEGSAEPETEPNQEREQALVQESEPEREREREPEPESKPDPEPETNSESMPRPEPEREPESKEKPELEEAPEPEPEESREEPEAPAEQDSITPFRTEPEKSPKKAPGASLEETKEVGKVDDTLANKPEKSEEPENTDGDRGSDTSPAAGAMEDYAEPARVSSALDASKDQDQDEEAHSKEITDGESAHQAPAIQSPQSTPEQGSQGGPREGQPEAAPEKTQSADLVMDDAPALADESKDEAGKEAIDTEIPDEAPSAMTEQPTEAMDIDETHEGTRHKDDEPTPTTSGEIADTTDVVSEVGGTIAEGALASVAHDKAALAGEKAFAEPPATPGNGVDPSTAANAPAEGMSLTGEKTGATLDTPEAVVEAREPQSQEPAEAPDATMQDASSLEVTAKSRPQQTAASDQTDRSDGTGEAHSDEQLATDGQISPPPTQILHTQPSQNSEKAPMPSQAASIISNDEQGAHLLTPNETQQGHEVEMVDTLAPATNHDNPADEDDVGPEDQIMAEILQHSPVRQDAMQHASPAETSPAVSHPKSPPQAELTETPNETPSRNAQRVPEVLVATKSLRSRRHSATKSSDHSDLSQVDPSILLAKASGAPTHSGNHSSPTGSVRMTRSRAGEDPSIQLARASLQAEEGKGRGKRKAPDDESIVSANSSPGSHRITRNKVEHKDPSILLAKASSPTTRQTRRHHTPDRKRETPKRETRSASRSLQLRGDSPEASFMAVKSPSVAGSTATVPEDESVGSLKLQLLKSLRTTLPDNLSLKLLRNSLNKTADILAVATATPAQPHRPKHGPRDYMLTLNITDPSVAPTGVCVAHIFRPHQTSLPIVRPGDVVLLRRVHVVSMKGRGYGVRTGDASAWAVFEKADEEMLPQIKGPPVELTADEIKYAEGLRRWWSLQDDKAMGKIEKASRKVTEAGKEDHK